MHVAVMQESTFRIWGKYGGGEASISLTLFVSKNVRLFLVSVEKKLGRFALLRSDSRGGKVRLGRALLKQLETRLD